MGFTIGGKYYSSPDDYNRKKNENISNNDRSADLRLTTRTSPLAKEKGAIITQSGDSIRYGGNNITTNDIAADVNLKKREYGAGGRSQYTDAEIAFMTGGNSTAPTTSTTSTKPTPSSTPSSSSSSRDIGDGGGDGDGGGGGGGSSTGTAGPGSASGPAGAEALAGYTEDEIAAALAGLEAQFGMTRAQLLADQSQAGAQYRLLLAQLERGRVRGIETATNDAVRRGIYRSGILGENIADVEAEALQGRITAEKQWGATQDATAEQLRGLQAMQTAQAAQIEAGLRRQFAQTLMQAGINPGGYNPNGIGQGGGGGAPAMEQVGGYWIDPNTGLATTRVDAGPPVQNTQGVGGAQSVNVSTTPVATTQQPVGQAPIASVPQGNVAPAYKDPRQAELAMEQYMAMLRAGGGVTATPQITPGYSPGGGYRIV